MTRIKNLDKALEATAFEKVKQRHRRTATKALKSAETLLDSLSQKNKELSTANLVLRKVLKEVYRKLPPQLKEEFNAIKTKAEIQIDE